MESEETSSGSALVAGAVNGGDQIAKRKRVLLMNRHETRITEKAHSGIMGLTVGYSPYRSLFAGGVDDFK